MTFINKHLEHIEDTFLGSQEQVENAYNFLIKYPADLGKEYHTTLKWDGGLSVVFGIKPGTKEKFIIGTKGVFNKTPKYATTKIEINNLYKPEVATILANMFDDLKAVALKFPGLYQGDLMWDPTSVKKGQFKPNTITYKFADSVASKFLFKTFKHALAIHTEYTGKDIESLAGKPFEPKSSWNTIDRASKIFFIEPVTLKGEMIKAFKPLYYLAVVHLDEKMETFEPLDEQYVKLIKRFINHQIKTHGDEYLGFVPHIPELLNFLESLEQTKHVISLQENLRTRSYFKKNIFARLESVVIATTMKTALIEMLNAPTRTYRIQAVEGDHEGFVVFEKSTQNGFKLVNRHIFSYNNFMEHGELNNG